VAVVPGNVFGESGEGFLRCSYATSREELIEAWTDGDVHQEPVREKDMLKATLRSEKTDRLGREVPGSNRTQSQSWTLISWCRHWQA